MPKTPTPQDFCDRAQMRVTPAGQMLARLDGVIYNVNPYGDDAVEVVRPDDGQVMAILTLRDGKFVPAG